MGVGTWDPGDIQRGNGSWVWKDKFKLGSREVARRTLTSDSDRTEKIPFW